MTLLGLALKCIHLAFLLSGELKNVRGAGGGSPEYR